MSRLAWGRPRIFVKDLDAVTPVWVELYTPVLDSTELTPTKGEKMEALVEGGDAEDVRYKRSKYALTYSIRKSKGLGSASVRVLPFHSVDGVVEHHFAVLLQPEDATCEGFHIGETAVSVDDSWKAAEGAIWQVTHDALRPSFGDTVKWGVVSITGEAGSEKISFTEGSSFDSGTPGEGSSALRITEESVTVLGLPEG